jgi:hypothetical protein
MDSISVTSSIDGFDAASYAPVHYSSGASVVSEAPSGQFGGHHWSRNTSSNSSVGSIRSGNRAYSRPRSIRVTPTRVPASVASVRSESRIRSKPPHRKTNLEANANAFPIGLYALVSMRNTEDDSLKLFNGSCHCQSVKFKILAPPDLVVETSEDKDAAKDKIYYRYTKVQTKHFEITQGQDSLTTYHVDQPKPSTRYYIHKPKTGARAFCKRCGVHVLYAPSKKSPVMQVNANCFPQFVNSSESQSDWFDSDSPSDNSSIILKMVSIQTYSEGVRKVLQSIFHVRDVVMDRIFSSKILLGGLSSLWAPKK